MKRGLIFILLALALIGVVDALYLTKQHYSQAVVPCSFNPLIPIKVDCGQVLKSHYAVMFGIPVALLGLIHYSVLAAVILLAILTNKKFFWFWIFLQTAWGALFSAYLMYLQLFVIKSICLYCTLSAATSFVLFILSYLWLETERKAIFIYLDGFIYRNILKPIFFLIDPEIIHVFMLSFGELLGNFFLTNFIIKQFLLIKNPKLKQKLAGINFDNPVGLAAGFDYEARLTQTLPALGFGFGTVGTITNSPYAGNPWPRLGRLPKSKSLMVNKGFKNQGAKNIVKKLEPLNFEIPIGISIGRTNSAKLKTQKQSIEDIIEAIKKFESSHIKHSYYELNISCPNIIHGRNITFYPPKKLEALLKAVEKLQIKKPMFIKMPIEKSNRETLLMLKVIAKFKFIKGVIFGNLQTNRQDPSLDPKEVAQFKTGKFSGKPCEKRSNELIKLTYKHFGKKLIIIGCGGVFSAEDAYKKIKLGASLVQLITGMIYQGPQLVAQINLELAERLKKDGLKNILHVVGNKVK